MTKEKWVRGPNFGFRTSWKHSDAYAVKEKVDFGKRFWWERLPILRNLATKRAVSKMHSYMVEALLQSLLDHLGLEAQMWWRWGGKTDKATGWEGSDLYSEIRVSKKAKKK